MQWFYDTKKMTRTLDTNQFAHGSSGFSCYLFFFQILPLTQLISPLYCSSLMSEELDESRWFAVMTLNLLRQSEVVSNHLKGKIRRSASYDASKMEPLFLFLLLLLLATRLHATATATCELRHLQERQL